MQQPPDPAVAAFAAALRRLREHKGWTPYRLAKESLTSQITIHRLETGERAATLPTLCRIADALGCSLDELAGRAAAEESGK
jgi:transcriptional regulator with XRE-family HTH domain